MNEIFVWHFECQDCEFDNNEFGRLLVDDEIHCPLCLLDNGHHVVLRKWKEDSNSTCELLAP